ncbi:MAG: hypothetical protein ACI9QL_003047 [Candidatus Omnitrophota bacterium]|jgi:uncharacterized protein YqgC (DUF456 family)
MFWLYAILFILAMVIGWVMAILGLGGTWIMLGGAVLYAWLIPAASPFQIGWTVVIILGVLAGLGELVEFLAGALGTKKAGGSRRSVALSVVGSLVGSLLGAIVGSAILPVIGTLIGVVFCAGLGAMGGSLLGERWKGTPFKESMGIGKAAFWGRLLGTVGKTLFGTLMALFASAAVFF